MTKREGDQETISRAGYYNNERLNIHCSTHHCLIYEADPETDIYAFRAYLRTGKAAAFLAALMVFLLACKNRVEAAQHGQCR